MGPREYSKKNKSPKMKQSDSKTMHYSKNLLYKPGLEHQNSETNNNEAPMVHGLAADYS